MEQQDRYIQALKKELGMVASWEKIHPKTIFIGGGTPSLLEDSLLESLLQTVEQYFVTDALEEYTMEINPGTVTSKKLEIMYHYRVNRLSIGVQSDKEEQLQQLGRIHTFAQAEETVYMARKCGFTNINLDFMYGLPNQTVEQWGKTLQHALTLRPQHLSLYQLNIEEGTRFYDWLQQGILKEFDDEVALAMYRLGQSILETHGYKQYEISNYAKPGFASQHNQTYWRTENYFGFGLGACTWMRPLRWNNVTDINTYVSEIAKGKFPRQPAEALTQVEQMEETVFMALRMQEGMAKDVFQQRFGVSVEQIYGEALERCRERQWIQENRKRISLTEEGRALGNLVFLEFMQ